MKEHLPSKQVVAGSSVGIPKRRESPVRGTRTFY